MKILKFSLGIILTILFSSCSSQNDDLYQLDESLTEVLEVKVMSSEISSQTMEIASVLDLNQSQAYANHINNLFELEIVGLKVYIDNNVSNKLINGELKMDDLKVYNFNDSNVSEVEITDDVLKRKISYQYVKDRELKLSFLTPGSDEKDFDVRIEIEFLGVFVN